MDVLFSFLMFALLVAVVALTLYWVIRKGVAAGIQDAHADEERLRTTRLE